jgi:hypothetical protein
MSGRQLFTIDNFRATGRPILSVLADPDSIFISGLSKFRRKTLYFNVVNDRTAVYYTTGITKTDPFVDLTRIKANFLPGYKDVILDPSRPVSPRVPKQDATTVASVTETSLMYLKNAPTAALWAILVPIGIIAFLINSVVQTIRSAKRIRLHEMGLAGIQIDDYRVPMMINELRQEIEDAYENLNSSLNHDYLAPSDDEGEDDELNDHDKQTLQLERKQSRPQFPTLALTPYQFDMIRTLDSVGWRKYPVWIHDSGHSHAAIIVRMEKPSFSEGHVVMDHWLKEEFLV